MNATSTLSEQLADRIREAAASDLTPELTDTARVCLLDFLSAVLSASRGPVAAAGLAAAAAFGAGKHTLLGTPMRGSTQGAVFYNALTATAEDLDDAHRYASGLHMSAITMPVLLALSEETIVSGEALIRGMLAGYEASSRVTRAADAGLRRRGYHSTGAAGVFGACAAAATLLGADRNTLINALGIAASGAGGLFAFLHEGSSSRHAHGAWASCNGLSACLLARAGLTGPRTILEGYDDKGKDGYLNAYAETWDARFLTQNSARPELLNTYHKLHAACGHAAPAITALQQLRDAVLPRRDAVSEVLIRGYKASAALNNPNPRSVAEAKFSLPFLCGVVLLYGQATRREMTPERLADAEVRRLAARVRVTEDPGLNADFPRLRAAEVEIRFHNGESLRRRVEAPLGMPENPAPAALIEAKFRDAAAEVLPEGNIEPLLRAVRELPDLPDTSRIPGLMAR